MPASNSVGSLHVERRLGYGYDTACKKIDVW